MAAENAGVGVLLTRIAPEIENVYVSPAAARMIGASVETVLRTPPLEFIAPQERSTVMARIEARRRGQPLSPSFQTILRRADGTELPVDVGIGYAQIDGEPA